MPPNPRVYGTAPYRVAVVHGGPGAPGSLAPVARELADTWGVLEPLQTAASLEGQVEELATLITAHAEQPVALIGHSWGAMLSLIVAARYPKLVERLILVASGVFEARYAASIAATRLSRLDEARRQELAALEARLADPETAETSAVLARLGRLVAACDSYDPLPLPDTAIGVDIDVYQRVWSEAAALRAAGGFQELARQVHCPVLAIHGSYDPHPAEGVREPLARSIADFRFVLLDACGHEPWAERRARSAFFELLRQELGRAAAPSGDPGGAGEQ